MTNPLQIVALRDAPERAEEAAKWYHAKWGIPLAAYRESISDSLKNPADVPQWYLVLDGETVAGGAGVIENDFHKRTDLTPNVCALYVEKPYRNRGVAKALLDHICRDLARMGHSDAYLVTEHEDFYEKCGWEFFCMAEEDEGGHMTRMYHRAL